LWNELFFSAPQLGRTRLAVTDNGTQ
jgi:hypothetical protein